MEEFSRLRGITKHQLRKVNNVCLYLRVITIADLANEAGDYIRDDMFWQIDSWCQPGIPQAEQATPGVVHPVSQVYQEYL